MRTAVFLFGAGVASAPCLLGALGCGSAVTIDETTGSAGNGAGGSASSASSAMTGGTASTTSTPTTGDTIVQIATGLQHACAVLEGGRVKCWGTNSLGQTGSEAPSVIGDAPGEMGSALAPVDLGTSPEGSPNRATSIVAGGWHTCALLEGGSVKCWGTSLAGELGIGAKLPVGNEPGDMGDALPFVDLGAGQTAVALAAGANTTCALLAGGAVKCWGRNSWGTLGIGSTEHMGDEWGEMGDALPAVDLGTSPGGIPNQAAAIALGDWHACALLEGGSVKCWGENESGQLGVGSQDILGDEPGEMGDALPVVDLGAGKKAIALSAGEQQTCALLDDHLVRCWGVDYLGLGSGNTAKVGDEPGEMGDALPVMDLGADVKVDAVSVGSLYVCAVLQGGAIKCWGGNYHGCLGLGSTEITGDDPAEMGAALPYVDLGTSPAGGPNTAVAIEAGFDITCVKLTGDTVKCWGVNDDGQLGVGHTNDIADEPGEMGDALPFIDVD